MQHVFAKSGEKQKSKHYLFPKPTEQQNDYLNSSEISINCIVSKFPRILCYHPRKILI